MPRPPASAVSALGRYRPPRLGRVFLRERLFAVLDAHHAACGLWIAGPPGMGKTTLTATYLQARGEPCLWLQLDAADAAISTSLHSPSLLLPTNHLSRAPLE